MVKTIVIDPEYQKLLDKANEKNKDIFISNSYLGHAVYASQLLLGRGDNKNPIKMFSGQLKGDCYDLPEMRNAFVKAVRRGAKIVIIAEKIGNKNFLEFAKERKIEVRELKKTRGELGMKELGHFLLVGSAFRIERPHALRNYIAKGAVNFNNNRIANILNLAFDSLTDVSEPQ